MDVTEAKLIIKSVDQLRATVETGFATAKQEREAIAKDVKLLTEWKNKQQGKEEGLNISEKQTVNYRTAFIATLAVLVTLIIGVITIYSQLN